MRFWVWGAVVLVSGIAFGVACDGYPFRPLLEEEKFLQGVCASKVCGFGGLLSTDVCMDVTDTELKGWIAVGCEEEGKALLSCISKIGCVRYSAQDCPVESAALEQCTGGPECRASGTVYRVSDWWLAERCQVQCGDIWGYCYLGYGHNDCWCGNNSSDVETDAGLQQLPTFSIPYCSTEHIINETRRHCPAWKWAE